ncbi:hypothetical protein ElyMa_002395300 [Elysia marginata]|uniref:Uncharacterized protein n=1 Tax=Elysia marginata TaxID=1093978 RepID=A0AAV4GG01_9GAST|nr:hypothetical protein ElyMa_002395300 [Elysia marginata]
MGKGNSSLKKAFGKTALQTTSVLALDVLSTVKKISAPGQQEMTTHSAQTFRRKSLLGANPNRSDWSAGQWNDHKSTTRPGVRWTQQTGRPLLVVSEFSRVR